MKALLIILLSFSLVACASQPFGRQPTQAALAEPPPLSPLPAKDASLESLYQDSLSTYQDTPVKVYTLQNAVILMVNNRDIFTKSSKALLSDQTQVLDPLFELLGSHQADQWRLVVQVFTDSSGGDALNDQLTTERAQLVYDYLIEQGWPADRVEAFGEGSAVPIASNEVKESRWVNRRVMISVMPIEEQSV